MVTPVCSDVVYPSLKEKMLETIAFYETKNFVSVQIGHPLNFSFQSFKIKYLMNRVTTRVGSEPESFQSENLPISDFPFSVTFFCPNRNRKNQMRGSSFQINKFLISFTSSWGSGKEKEERALATPNFPANLPYAIYFLLSRKEKTKNFLNTVLSFYFVFSAFAKVLLK